MKEERKLYKWLRKNILVDWNNKCEGPGTRGLARKPGWGEQHRNMRVLSEQNASERVDEITREGAY